MEVATDVALLAVVDPVRVRHRLHGDPDWWVHDEELMQEMNRGSALFLAVGADGYYDVLIHRGPPKISGAEVRATLVCTGGRLYVGGYISDALSPPGKPFGGQFLTCPQGAYDVRLRRRGALIDMSVEPLKTWPRNSFRNVPRLE